jgi:hypothetical protein
MSSTPVYVIGTLGFDFVSVERREGLRAAGVPIGDRAALAKYLYDRRESFAATLEQSSVLWTLAIDGVPAYALQCTAPGATGGLFRDSVLSAAKEASDTRFVAAGRLAGTVALLDGPVVPVIEVVSFRPLIDPATALLDAIVISGSVAAAPPRVDVKDLRDAANAVFTSLGQVLPISLSFEGTPPEGAAAPYRGGVTFLLDGKHESKGLSASGAKLILFCIVDPQTTQRVNVYLRTYQSTGQIEVSHLPFSSVVYRHALTGALQPVGGLPGACDYVCSLVVKAGTAPQVLLTLDGMPLGGMRPIESRVILRGRRADNSDEERAFGVGMFSNISGLQDATINVPPGLRVWKMLTTGPEFLGSGEAPLGPPEQSIWVEPDCYVGIQGVTVEPADRIVAADVEQSFLDSIFRLLTNQGMTSEERAVNFALVQAATTREMERANFTALVAAMPPEGPVLEKDNVLAHAMSHGLQLSTIEARPTPLSREGADCWDVLLSFCDPEQVHGDRLVHRFTVDVADQEPVQIAPRRSFRLS